MAKNDTRSSDVNLKHLVRGQEEGNHARCHSRATEGYMSPIEKLKTEAAALEENERALGRPMKHCAALEEVAKKHGFENWRACSASLEKESVASTPPKALPANPCG